MAWIKQEQSVEVSRIEQLALYIDKRLYVPVAQNSRVVETSTDKSPII
jgi:hypothetical protein